jgi:hypothetical protein
MWLLQLLTVNVAVATPDAATCAYSLTPANNTCSGTCPLLINYHAGNGTADTGIVKTLTTSIVAGRYRDTRPGVPPTVRGSTN